MLIMKLFLIRRTDKVSYDDYESAVVAAPSVGDAQRMHPQTGDLIDDWNDTGPCWVNYPDKVAVKYLGETDHPQGVICASFNAG